MHCLSKLVGAYARGQLQLGTLSTRIALYTRRWRASPGVLTYAARRTFSGLAALCRTPKIKLIGRPVPEIWPNLARTDRHDLPTSQPDTRTPGHPDSQPAILPVPSCSWAPRGRAHELSRSRNAKISGRKADLCARQQFLRATAYML